MTYVHKATKHAEHYDNYLDNSFEEPENWVILVGNFAQDYNITAPEATPEDPEAGDGVFNIGAGGFNGDVFAEDADPVYEVGHKRENASMRFMHTLLVHRRILSDEVNEELYGEPWTGDDVPEVEADD